MTEKMKKKLQSRKFWAWVVWGFLTLVCLFSPLGDFAAVLPWFGLVTLIYLGAEGYIDSLGVKKGIPS